MSKKQKKRNDDYLIRLGVMNPPPPPPQDTVWIWGQQTITVQHVQNDARPRRLRANWTMELADDLNGVHGIRADRIIIDEIGDTEGFLE